MIVELTVENLAIIERAQVAFGPGFTVLTGETGAGKSLLVDALELAIGQRADTDLVRAGARLASVNVTLDLSASPEAAAKCAELGVALEDAVLYIQREVFAEGRSQCRVAGKLTPVAVLKQIGNLLVDLHGQHDHQSLLDPLRHLGYLDQWIGAPVHAAATRVREKFAAYHQAHVQLAELRKGMRDREQRLDLLRYQINEIESIRPIPGESEELETKLFRLRYAEKLATATFAALDAVGDRENCASDLLGLASKSLGDVTRYDASLDEFVAQLEEARVLAEEVAHRLRDYAEQLEADPAELDSATARLDSLKRLKRKYGETEEAVLAHMESAAAELALLDDADRNEEDLQAAATAALAEAMTAANELSAIRRGKASEFAALVQAELHDLGMTKAQFEVGFAERMLDAEGIDEVRFQFSANPGEPLRALDRIASGGEISRLMLSIKTTLAGRAGVPTLIFDEVDTGLGGKAAATVARKLEALAAHYQILVISHLPQIAARAKAHFRIEKVEVSGRVVTQIRALNPDERVVEIARMLAGETLTPAALANAREMLQPA